jgi:amidase
MTRYEPTPDSISYTFGGKPAIAQIKPGEHVQLRTLDCYGGAVKDVVTDLPSQVCTFPYLNPVTGPSGGAESGSAMPATAFSLLSGLCGGGCGVRQVSCTGLWCRA